MTRRPSVIDAVEQVLWRDLQMRLANGEPMSKDQVAALLAFQYPQLHKVMFMEARTPRHRIWEKRYAAAKKRYRT